MNADVNFMFPTWEKMQTTPMQNQGTPAQSREDAQWRDICHIEEIPRLGARVVKSRHGNVAVFRTAQDEVFALADRCPHKGGPLSQGIVHGKQVTCPLHNWNIGLSDGRAMAPDEGCAAIFAAKLLDGRVFLNL